jgi:alanine racemase
MFNAFNTRSNATPSTSRVVIPDPASQTHGIGSTPTSPTSTPTARDTTVGPRSRNPASVSKQSQGPRSGFMASTLGRLTGSTQAAEAKALAEANATDKAQRRTFARVVATIDLGAMRRNFRLGMALIGAGVHPDLSGDFPYGPGEKRNDETHPPKWTPGVRPAAVVKASGYGLDDDSNKEEVIKIATTLASEGCRDFFVASAGEAADLRDVLKAQQPDIEKGVAINMLDGVAPGEDLQYLVNHKITPVLNGMDELALWNAKGEELGKPLPTILQFDSGMARAGIRMHHREQVLQDLKDNKYPFLDIKLAMTHLSDSDDATRVPLPAGMGPAEAHDPADTPADTERKNKVNREVAEYDKVYNHTPGDKTRAQLASFEAVCDELRKINPSIQASIGASSTVFIGKDPSQSLDLHKDMVRMGATFHGQAPFGSEDHPLEPTLDIKAKARQVETAEPGEVVGYGSRYKVGSEQETHAAIAWGYTEGAPRRNNGNADQRPHVLVGTGANQEAAEFIGATSMDQSQIKTSPGKLKPGEMVTVLGGDISVNKFSQMHGSGVSELSVKLGSRVVKEYVDDNAPSQVGEPFVDDSPHAWKD